MIKASYTIKYLPLYSLDFNLIEEFFSTLKAWIRRYKDHIREFNDFSEFLAYAITREGGRSAIG